jgi:hypothetical protein
LREFQSTGTTSEVIRYRNEVGEVRDGALFRNRGPPRIKTHSLTVLHLRR